MSWGWFKKTTTARAADGIKARSQRGQIGEKWWSRRFIEALESFADGGRLSRGRTYARKGQVLGLGVSSGVVEARVQGSRRTPYRVEIGFKPLTEAAWDQIEAHLLEDALLCAALCSGTMPKGIEAPFQAAGQALLPSRREHLALSCSCPDWGYPCKHAAAACYILAERFDEDPFALFLWRGRAVDALLERLEAHADEGHDTAPLDSAPLASFWKTGDLWRGMALSLVPPEIPDHALRQLGMAGLKLGAQDISERMAPAYSAMTSRAAGLASGDTDWRVLRAHRPEDGFKGLSVEALMERLDDAYDALSEAQRRAIFGAWCAGFGQFELDGEHVDMAEAWHDKEALFDLLADEDPEDLREWLRRCQV